MANSFVEYTGDGNTTNFSITFAYLDSSHVSCTVDGSSTSFTFSSGGTVATISPAPANGALIKFSRNSSQNTRLTDYASGSVLKEEDLDTDSKQAFFLAQESIDNTGSKLGQNTSNFQFDALNKRIINVADPTSAQDASTKAYTDSILTTNNTAVANATTQANNAAASAATAAGHVSTAQGHANTASGHATTASNQATAAANSATQAANSASSATVTTGLVIAMAIAL